MKNKISVLIVDDNMEITRILSKYIENQNDMRVSGIAHNGEEALAYIQTTNPDVIILDLIMPKLDGIGVLQKLDHMDLIETPKIILYSIADTAMTVASSCVEHIKVECCLSKSQPYETVCEAIRRVCWYIGFRNYEYIENKIFQIFSELNIPVNFLGYRYCKSAVRMVIDDAELKNNITNKLYPQIAELYDSTPSRVERAMRYAIEASWKYSNPKTKKKYFSSINVKPTNREFIIAIVDRLRLKLE